MSVTGWVWFYIGSTFFFSIVAFFAVTIASRRLARSRLVIRRYVNPAYDERKCPHCTMGTQYLHPETGWGKIPPHLYMITQGRSWMEAPQANVRRCGTCGGNGSVSTRRGIPADVEQDFGPREVTW